MFFRPLAKGRGGEKEPRSIPGAFPHDFRRTAARNMVRRCVPERVAMLTGTKHALCSSYNIVSDGDLRTAARWPDGVTCPTCGSTKVGYLANQRRCAAASTPSGSSPQRSDDL